ncbi:PREDICTED: uncharacterized protein LOC109240305 [Nicotiana attenuata]|uniref:uncharacterized protein LOC109240305 n=1 Tax=Nicotiana attenuata TaxID=49451 RepID=UPI0009048516|nr:PREDICTED: uncharacterized protein LOC109240305 [Nicotiana attenuata]
MIKYFEGYKPVIITRRVTWQLPFQGWYKCNIDGASRGNPGPSSLGFCVRNDEGDLIYAREVDLGETTNVAAEARAIVQGLEYFVEHNLHPLILETDSLVMKKVIEGEYCLNLFFWATDKYRLRDQNAMVSHEYIAHKKEAESAHLFLHLFHNPFLMHDLSVEGADDKLSEWFLLEWNSLDQHERWGDFANFNRLV